MSDRPWLDGSLMCRCMAFSFLRDRFPIQDPCHREATQEDGLCDNCRCEHGCCEDHRTMDQLMNCRIRRLKHEIQKS